MLQPEHFLVAFSSPTALLGTVAALLLLYFATRSLTSSAAGRKEPPGPRPLPLLGNLMQLNLKRLYWSLFELSKKYGPVFTIYLGPKKVVVLAGYETVKDALVGHAEEFGDRSILPIFYDTSENHGIIFANGDSWKELRRFALTTLRDFGMGKRVAEEKILQESGYLNQVIESHGGKPFDTSIPLNNATSNIISSIVYGQRFEYDDPQFIAMVKRSNESIRVNGSAQIQIYNTFPKFTKWFKNRKVIIQNREEAIRDVTELMQKLKDTLNPQMCRGIIDCFLVRKKKDEESRVVNSPYHERNLVATVNNLFAAGTDTTASTLRWALLLMAKYPQIQERVHQELCAVIGSRPPRVEDRKNMPYTDAVIHEVQRFGNIAPMAIAHETSRDVTFQGYFIKEGTTVFPLLTSVMYDENEWETPNTFNPTHFLDKEGKFVKRDAFLPFSAGRRVCLGEGLAKMELFLFFTSLLQRFRFTPPPGLSEEEMDLTPAIGFTLSPTSHKLCAVSRQ